MNDILKQRLVGALILLALGVVFWPIIFVEPGEKELAEHYIPSPPEVSTADLASPQEGELRGSPELAENRGSPIATAPVASELAKTELAIGAEVTAAVPAEPSGVTAQSTAIPAAGEVRSASPERLAMDTDGVPVAWTLQVATVSSAEKAENLRQQLLETKQKVYVTTLHSGGKTLYRVCIGPKFERVELEKLQAGINARFGVTSIVARHLP